MDNYWAKFKTPFLCFGGFSGVGKTTLISKLIKKFNNDGDRVGYYKHDSHRFIMDKEGKDTHKCAEAGAEVVAINDPMHFAIIGDDNFKQVTISHALEQCDCILIEGYKQSPFNKIVFLDKNGELPISPETKNIKAIIHQGNIPDSINSELPAFHRDNVESIYDFVKKHFQSCASEMYGAVFVGGQSSRMEGRPKFSLSYDGITEPQRMTKILSQFCEKVVLSSRSNLEMDGLPEVLQCERIDDEHTGLGPVGGLATLMSRFPDKAFLITACDLPLLDEEIFSRLISNRNPLKYGTCFVKKGRLGFEPMCAVYEPKFIFPLFQAMSSRELSLSRIIRELPFQHVAVLEDQRLSFSNVNHPEEYEAARLKRELKSI
jgi:molybdopterin-guanine dinucleotide biosynthesis protein A